METPNLTETQPAAVPQAQLPDETRSLIETVPTRVTPEIPTEEPPAPPRKKKGCLRAWMMWTLGGLLLLAAIASLSGLSGYRSGIEQRKALAGTQQSQFVETQFALAVADMDKERYDLAIQRYDWFKNQPISARGLSEPVAQELARQFQLGLEDMQAKRFRMAQLRFEWIVQWDPNFPGITDKLADVIYQQNITATPTPVPTPTLTPTPDLRDVQKMFTDSQQSLAAGNWSVTIDTLLGLRKRDANYQAVQVDGMLYVALRGRGIDKIFGRGKTDPTITRSDLEGGIYDLALAGRFGPLDEDAKAWQRRAEWYITGASFWGVDWANVVAYFELVYIEAPYMADGSGWLAKDRYRGGLIEYGGLLASQNDWCGAQDAYEKAAEIQRDDKLDELITQATEECDGGSDGEEPTGEPTSESPTEEPTSESPTEEPTPESLAPAPVALTPTPRP